MGRGGAGAFFLFFPNADSKSNDDNRFNSFSSMKTFKYDFPCIMYDLYARQFMKIK